MSFPSLLPSFVCSSVCSRQLRTISPPTLSIRAALKSATPLRFLYYHYPLPRLYGHYSSSQPLTCLSSLFCLSSLLLSPPSFSSFPPRLNFSSPPGLDETRYTVNTRTDYLLHPTLLSTLHLAHITQPSFYQSSIHQSSPSIHHSPVTTHSLPPPPSSFPSSPSHLLLHPFNIGNPSYTNLPITHHRHSCFVNHSHTFLLHQSLTHIPHTYKLSSINHHHQLLTLFALLPASHQYV